jgi:hypothetical protein
MEELKEAITRDLWWIIIRCDKTCFDIVQQLALTTGWLRKLILDNKYKIADFYTIITREDKYFYSRLPNGIRHGNFLGKYTDIWGLLVEELREFILDKQHNLYTASYYQKNTSEVWYTTEKLFDKGKLVDNIQITRFKHDGIILIEQYKSYALSYGIKCVNDKIVSVIKCRGLENHSLEPKDWPTDVKFDTLRCYARQI